jgi:methionine-gamma-lyase
MSTKPFNPANAVQDVQVFGEFGGVNPSITDSSTYTYLAGKTMEEVFGVEREGCYLYSRHLNPSASYLGKSLAKLENTEAAQVTASGMGAVSAVLMQICGAGDHIVSSRTIYGGTYAFMKHFLPRFNITTDFVDVNNLDAIRAAITPNTKVLYCEILSNPLLEVADVPALAEIAREHNLQLVVDNTFTPMIFSPVEMGAHIVIHSLTKFINGASDTVGGAVCGTKEFVHSLIDVNHGAAMLLGPTMDSLRAAGILKNSHTLHIRMQQHSYNANYLAHHFEELGLRVLYPGLESHPQHELFANMAHPEFGFGGMMTIDVGEMDVAYKLLEAMQNAGIGYLAVSLGFYRTLFSVSGASTSSEIPEDEQEQMGLSPGLIRFSIGLDHDIERTCEMMKACMREVGILA